MGIIFHYDSPFCLVLVSPIRLTELGWSINKFIRNKTPVVNANNNRNSRMIIPRSVLSNICLNIFEWSPFFPFFFFFEGNRSGKRLAFTINTIHGNGDTLFTTFYAPESSTACKNTPSIDDSLIERYAEKFCWHLVIYDLPGGK